RIHADAAERDDLAALEAVDDPPRDRPALGVERVGVAGSGHELVLALGGDLHDLGTERRERLQLRLVTGTGRVVRDSGWGDYLELRHDGPPGRDFRARP